RGRKIDAGLEAMMKKSREGCAIAVLRVREIPNLVRSEVEAEHRTDAMQSIIFFHPLQCLARPRFESCPKRLKLAVCIGAPELAELCETCRECERISRECPRLVDRAVWRKFVHDVGPSAERADGQSAADDFAEGREIR